MTIKNDFLKDEKISTFSLGWGPMMSGVMKKPSKEYVLPVEKNTECTKEKCYKVGPYDDYKWRVMGPPISGVITLLITSYSCPPCSLGTNVTFHAPNLVSEMVLNIPRI